MVIYAYISNDAVSEMYTVLHLMHSYHIITYTIKFSTRKTEKT